VRIPVVLALIGCLVGGGLWAVGKFERRQSRKLTDMAANYLKEGKAEEARMGLETALRLDPRNAKALRMIAGLRRAQGADPEALDAMRRLAESGQMSLDDLVIYAQMAARAGDLALAERLANNAGRGGNTVLRHMLRAELGAAKNDPEAVETVTRDLADYLRFTLGEARTLEPLSRELRALEKYLAIQHARFGDNLVCRFSCDRAAHAVIVPPMLIQPILENALHYGAQTSSMPLRVSVTAKVVDGWLEVVVANTGRWVPPDTTRSPSTGIRSLRKRLALLVDEAATVDTVIDPDLDGGWVRVVIRMPATLTQPAPATHEPTPATELV
jgi:Tfp pilus assembly protein PilF